MLYQSAITSEGKKVIGGIYEFYETHGLPFDAIFDVLKAFNYLPDSWKLFKSICLKANRKRAYLVLEQDLARSYGKEFSDKVINKIKTMEKKWKY